MLNSVDSQQRPLHERISEAIPFICNICGSTNKAKLIDLDREIPSCICGSNVRWRSLIHILSLKLFGTDLALPHFPKSDEVGVGLSDDGSYAIPLAQKLNYTNTYYHQEPRLDITSIADREGLFDFIISSDVFEHVPPPVQIVFRNSYQLLRPGGLLILTVPYTKEPDTVEHFPELYDYRLIEKDNSHILQNTTRDGQTQVFDNLIFHGGTGETLEMRRFSESSVVRELETAGFGEIKIHNEPALYHGIYHLQDWALPISATKF